jgi:U4/U6 small nuclear ribonucleoprotein PRP4
VEYGEHTEAAKRAMRQQAERQAQVEARRRARAMVVPTDDREVRVWLRRLREPVTLFGERAMERRERLRILMATLDDSQRAELTARIMQLELEQKAVQAERFFTEGAPGLLDLRRCAQRHRAPTHMHARAYRRGSTRARMCRRICTYAAVRAGERLAAQRSAAVDGGAAAADERRLVLEDAALLRNTSSQIGGRRPLQGCEVSPDGTTVATADWDGIVAFWTLEEKLVRLKMAKVRHARACVCARGICGMRVCVRAHTCMRAAPSSPPPC